MLAVRRSGDLGGLRPAAAGAVHACPDETAADEEAWSGVVLDLMPVVAAALSGRSSERLRRPWATCLDRGRFSHTSWSGLPPAPGDRDGSPAPHRTRGHSAAPWSPGPERPRPRPLAPGCGPARS